MQYITEYKNFYEIGDIIILEYWYNDMLTKAKIIEKISKNSVRISHNIKESKIQNAPDEIIKINDIIDKAR